MYEILPSFEESRIYRIMDRIMAEILDQSESDRVQMMKNFVALLKLPERLAILTRFSQAIAWGAVLVSVSWWGAGRSIAAPTEQLIQPAVSEDLTLVLSALSPAITIDLSSGIGRTSGTVSTDQQIYSFNAIAGYRVTIDINVTQVLPGYLFNDDDSQIFLFNSMGQLVAENDDDNRTYQSRLRNFIVPADGTYFVAITTFNNDPIFDSNNVIVGWRGNGGSNIRYDLAIITNIPR